MSNNITEIAKAFKRTNPGSFDALYGPYDSLAAACLAVPNVTKLVDGVLRNFRTGQVIGLNTPGGIVEYWWMNGFFDTDLELKDSTNKISIKLLPRDQTNEVYYDGAFVNSNHLWGYDSAKFNKANKLQNVYFKTLATGPITIKLITLKYGVTAIIYTKIVDIIAAGISKFSFSDLGLTADIYSKYPYDDIYVTATNTNSGLPRCFLYKNNSSPSDGFVIQNGVYIKTPTLDYAFWIETKESKSIAQKIEDFYNYFNLSIKGDIVNSPSEVKTIDEFIAPVNPDFYWGEKTNFIGFSSELQSLTILAANAGNITIGFVVVSDNIASIVYSVSKVIAASGTVTYTAQELGVPSSLYSNPKVYVILANQIGAVDQRVLRYKSVAEEKCIYFDKATNTVTYTTLAFNYFITVKSTGNPLVDKLNGLEYKVNSNPNVITQPTTGAELQILLNTNSHVQLKAGIIVITQPLVVPPNTKISGVRGGTILRLSGSGAIVNLDGSSYNIEFESLTFDGNSPVVPVAMSRADIIGKPGMGVNMGIYANGYAKNISIHNCEFINFNGAGINLYRTHQLYGKTFKITDNQFNNCFIGLLSDVRSEYHSYVGNTFAYNRFGAFIEGGNNFGSNNQFNANGIGLVLSGTSADNDSHGTMGNCSFNHNQSFSIYCIDINNGFTFAGCHIFQGNICLDNAKGFVFTGGILACGIQIVNPNTAYNIISQNIFVLNSYNGGTIVGDKSKLLMQGNRFIYGENSASINQEV